MKRWFVFLFAVIVLAFPAGSSAITGPQAPADEEDAGPIYLAYATYDGCWNHAWSQQHGYWPNYQRVTVHTRWCGTGPSGRITYRNSWVTLDSYFCGASGAYVGTVSAYDIGWPTMIREGGGYFDCPSGVPWWSYHFHRWLQIEYTSGGGSWPVASG